MRNFLTPLFFCVCSVANIFGQSQSALNRFVSDKVFRNSSISILIQDAISCQNVASYFPNTSLAPASTLKLITTATALEMFGPDFQFETEVAYSGKIVDGVLDGDLYIVGHGDPTLGSEHSQQPNAFFETILSELKKRGVSQITGRIIGDESAYNTELIPPRTTWEDMGNYYAAGVSALNFGDNSYRLTFRTGKEGTTPSIINLQPAIDGLSFSNHLIAKSNEKDSAYLYGMPYGFERCIYGSIPANRAAFVIKGDVPDPALFCVSELRKYFISNGVKIDKSSTTSRKIDNAESFSYPKTKLFIHKSDKLSHIVQITNKKSYNFYAEALLRLIASKFSKDASLPAGIAAIKRFWSDRRLNTDFLMYDGSGLSPANRVNAAFFVGLLDYMSKSRNKDAYFNSLAVAGVDGTLRSFLANTALIGKVRAKSGSYEGVLSYCGQIEKKNKKYNFCIIINAFTCSSSDVKRAIERLLVDF